jgi:hypothetical protein
MPDPVETPASIKEIKRSDKKRFYRLLEVEYVEGPEISLTKLATRYNLSKEAVYKYAKRHGWKQKKTEFKKELESKKVDETEHREQFRGFAVQQLQALAWRANEVLNKERGEVAEDKRVDTVAEIMQRNSMLHGLVALGTIIHGPPMPAEMPDTIFEAVIVEQKVSYRQVGAIPQEPEPLEVEIPQGFTITDVTGRPQEET